MSNQAEQFVRLVYEALRREIVTGKLFPGEQLNQREVSARLGVSRTPVREAIRQLEHEGLVKVRHNRGAVVVKLDAEEIRELFEAREALEGMAARLAATRMPKSRMYGAEAALKEQSMLLEANEDVPPTVDLHDMILEGSKSRYLITMMGHLTSQLATLRYASTRSERRRLISNEEHRLIIGALLERDPDRAEAAMRAHVQSVCANVLKLKGG